MFSILKSAYNWLAGPSHVSYEDTSYQDLQNETKKLHAKMKSVFKEYSATSDSSFSFNPDDIVEYNLLKNRFSDLKSEDGENSKFYPIKIYLDDIDALVHPKPKKLEKENSAPKRSKRQQTPSLSTLTPTASSTTPSVMLPHGMTNGSTYCYANSAYQLLANIDSLKTSVLDLLPEDLALLKNYSECRTGKELLIAINKTRGANPFIAGRGYSAGDIYSHLINLVDLNSPCFTLKKETTVNSYDEDQETLKHIPTPADKKAHIQAAFEFDNNLKRREIHPSYDLALHMSQIRGTSVDFNTALIAGANENPKHSVTNTDNHLSYVINTRETRFTRSPKQLFIKAGRIDTEKKDNRPFTSVPETLDLKKANLLDDGIENPPRLLKLKGFILHQGSGLGSVGGHYIAFFQKKPMKAGEYPEWYCADDATITPIKRATALEKAKLGSDFYYDDDY